MELGQFFNNEFDEHVTVAAETQKALYKPFEKLVFGIQLIILFNLLLLIAYLISWPGLSLINLIFTFLPTLIFFLLVDKSFLTTTKLFIL